MEMFRNLASNQNTQQETVQLLSWQHINLMNEYELLLYDDLSIKRDEKGTFFGKKIRTEKLGSKYHSYTFVLTKIKSQDSPINSTHRIYFCAIPRTGGNYHVLGVSDGNGEFELKKGLEEKILEIHLQ